VQTGCSTSLVAVHSACRSIAAGECDVALAGGVQVQAAQRTGYLYEEGGIHSPAVVSRIIHASEGEQGPGAQERDVTVMFCDIVGFTTLCQQIPPAKSAAVLNAFLTRMTDVVFEYEGTLDKFLGDALLAVFGAPFDQPLHPLKAVQAALAMRKALVELNASQDTKLGMRIAINTGLAWKARANGFDGVETGVGAGSGTGADGGIGGLIA
jgi:class 3 adenylate cyclase